MRYGSARLTDSAVGFRADLICASQGPLYLVSPRSRWHNTCYRAAPSAVRGLPCPLDPRARRAAARAASSTGRACCRSLCVPVAVARQTGLARAPADSAKLPSITHLPLCVTSRRTSCSRWCGARRHARADLAGRQREPQRWRHQGAAVVGRVSRGIRPGSRPGARSMLCATTTGRRAFCRLPSPALLVVDDLLTLAQRRHRL